jgi:hypothetical protein
MSNFNGHIGGPFILNFMSPHVMSVIFFLEAGSSSGYVVCSGIVVSVSLIGKALAGSGDDVIEF